MIDLLATRLNYGGNRKIPQWQSLIIQRGAEKFFGTLISFFRSFISFFRTFISALREGFSFSRELSGNSSVETDIREDALDRCSWTWERFLIQPYKTLMTFRMCIMFSLKYWLGCIKLIIHQNLVEYMRFLQIMETTWRLHLAFYPIEIKSISDYGASL